MILYTILNSIYLSYFLGIFSLLLCYIVQRNNNTLKLFYDRLGLSSFNLFIIQPFITFFYLYYFYQPNFKLYELLYLPIIIILTDPFIYIQHYILHWPPLYKRFHKQHHTSLVPGPIDTFYGHPIDYFIGITFSLIPAVIFNISTYTFLISFFITFMISIFHSHYEKDIFHYYHHQHRNCNYGSGLFLDKLLKTIKMS